MSGTRSPTLAQITEFCYWRSSHNLNAGGESTLQFGGAGYRVESPQLVMIFGWADAKLPQIMSYSDMYATMHPSTPQLIVECDIAAFGLGTSSMNIARMKLVAEYLLSLDMWKDKNCKWLIHTLSSGGIIQLHWLTLYLNKLISSQSKSLTGLPLPPTIQKPTLLIVDSAPSVGAYSEFLYGYAGSHVRAAPVFGWSRVLEAMGMRPTVKGFIHKFLEAPPSTRQEERRFRPTDRSIPRLYLYSDTDALARVDGVRGHISRMKALGISVREEEFKGSPHVLHARKFAQRYWAAVEGAWNAAAKPAEGSRAKL